MSTRNLTIAFFVLLAAGCSGNRAKTPEEARETLRQDTRDEVTIGREMAARLFGKFGRYRNDQVLEYVNLVGRSIASQVGRPELDFKFAVLNTNDRNGYACPGGYVFVTRGLLNQLTSESELAGVLSHEIAHVNAKHMYETIQSRREMGWTEVLARFLSHGYGDLGGSLAGIVDQGLNVLLNDGYGQKKELEADQMGVTFATTAGYDPRGLTDVLERISDEGNSQVLEKTHPPFATRISNIKDFSTKNGLRPGQLSLDKNALTQRFHRFQVALEGETQ